MPMTDTRKVRPVAPLDAERAEGDGWNVRFPRAGSQRATPSDVYLWWADAAFAAAFMPAELFDAVLDGARLVGHAWLVWDASPSGTDEEDDAETALLDAAQNAYVAVRAYDAHTKGA